MVTFLFLLLLAQIPNSQSENGAITGSIHTGSGSPAMGVRVTAMVPPNSFDDVSRATSMASIGLTDSEGNYRLEGIPPGRYYITAGRIDVPTYYPGTTVLSGGVTVPVKAGGTVTGVDFNLKEESQGRAVLSNQFLFSLIAPGFHIPVSVQVDGGGRIPVFQNGSYPLIRLTDASNNNRVEVSLGESAVMLPIPSGSQAVEYRVVVDGLQDGYAVKSIMYGSADLQKVTLKASLQGLTIQQSTVPPSSSAAAVSGAAAVSNTTLSIILSKSPSTQTREGISVTGHSFGPGDEVYISGFPGFLYSDGSFEFRNVSPGLHTILKFSGNSVTALPILIGNRDLDIVSLQRPQMLPVDIFTAGQPSFDGSVSESKALSMASIRGHVRDEMSGEPLNEGTVTISGYGTSVHSFAMDGDGGFEIPDLLPGAYNLTINVSGYSNAPREVAVGVGDIKLDLAARKETR